LAIAVAVLGLALVGAGCGGGDDEAAGDDTTIVTETTDTESTETTDDTDTDVGDLGDVSEDCLAAVGAFVALSQAVGAAGAGGDPGNADESAELFSEYADKAPEEIQDDIRVLADAYAAYIEELSGLGLEAGATPSADQIQQLTEAAEKLNTAEVQAASESFNSWATTNCPACPRTAVRDLEGGRLAAAFAVQADVTARRWRRSRGSRASRSSPSRRPRTPRPPRRCRRSACSPRR
jgi:hypothetical protein